MAKRGKDSLGDRMKEFYENRAKTKLTRRMPVIIRLDGRAFHTFTKGFAKPFDKRMTETMQEVTMELCKNIQGCVFGYTQSDEITLILVDYNDIGVSAWYDYEVQKMCSVAASMVTLYFNRIFHDKICQFINEHGRVVNDPKTYGEELSNSVKELIDSYKNAIELGAMFDARCFNVPQNDLLNAVLWRIKDATRNSINSLGQTWFKHKELEGKNTNQVQDMLFEKYGINWNNLSNEEKCGTFIVKKENKFSIEDTCIKSYKDLEEFFTKNGVVF